MANKRIFNVKEAAQVIGVSTNTMYKYLNTGKIAAARGHKRGTFRISAKSLENFLGDKLTPEQLTHHDPPSPYQGEGRGEVPMGRGEVSNMSDTPATQITLALRVARLLLIIALVLVILDIVLNPDFSLGRQFVRMLMISIFVMLAYQFGGFNKK